MSGGKDHNYIALIEAVTVIAGSRKMLAADTVLCLARVLGFMCGRFGLDVPLKDVFEACEIGAKESAAKSADGKSMLAETLARRTK